MHFATAVWLLAVVVRQASNTDNVPGWISNSTGCRAGPLPPQTATPRLQSPAAAVAAFAALSVAQSAPAVAGLAAVTATLLAFDFGTVKTEIRPLAEACAVALTAGAPLAAWGATSGHVGWARTAICTVTVLAVWLSLSGHELTVLAVVVLLPAINLAARRVRVHPIKPVVFTILLIAATVCGATHARDLGICNNDINAAYRRDWTFAFALFFWAVAVASLTSDATTPLATKFLVLPALATTGMGVMGAKNGWGVAASATAAVLLLGLVAAAAPRAAATVKRDASRTFVNRVVLF
ncbi:hypothetical protein [Nereida ignava]|uniref:hypothetical protein n=1 Tax=Nereida ignava TaxID=282199 RepID=UPI0030FC00B3